MWKWLCKYLGFYVESCFQEVKQLHQNYVSVALMHKMLVWNAFSLELKPMQNLEYEPGFIIDYASTLSMP